MRGLILATSLFCVATAGAAQETGNRLTLLCSGGGSANKAMPSFGFGWDNQGNSGSGIGSQQRAVGFQDQLQLWIEGDAGKARVPGTMLPAIRGGENGWFDIKDIRITDGEITGTVTVSIVNRPKLVIDRLSGSVSLAGKSGQFNGQCQKFDPETVKKAF